MKKSANGFNWLLLVGPLAYFQSEQLNGAYFKTGKERHRVTPFHLFYSILQLTTWPKKKLSVEHGVVILQHVDDTILCIQDNTECVRIKFKTSGSWMTWSMKTGQLEPGKGGSAVLEF